MEYGLLEIFPYEKRYWYPHMKPDEVEMWERYIEKYPKAFDYCQYDVPVGSVPDFVESGKTGPEDKSHIKYQRKIDVIGFKGDEIHIIELKERAGMAAVGQLLGYGKLYKRDYSPPGDVALDLITNEIDPDASEFAAENGVLVITI